MMNRYDEVYDTWHTQPSTCEDCGAETPCERRVQLDVRHDALRCAGCEAQAQERLDTLLHPSRLP